MCGCNNVTNLVLDRRQDQGENDFGRNKNLLLPSVEGHQELQRIDLRAIVNLQAFIPSVAAPVWLFVPFTFRHGGRITVRELFFVESGLIHQFVGEQGRRRR